MAPRIPAPRIVAQPIEAPPIVARPIEAHQFSAHRFSAHQFPTPVSGTHQNPERSDPARSNPARLNPDPLNPDRLNPDEPNAALQSLGHSIRPHWSAVPQNWAGADPIPFERWVEQNPALRDREMVGPNRAQPDRILFLGHRLEIYYQLGTHLPVETCHPVEAAVLPGRCAELPARPRRPGGASRHPSRGWQHRSV